MSNLSSMLDQVGGVCQTPGTDEAAVRVVLRAIERGVLDVEGAREVLQMLGLAPEAEPVPTPETGPETAQGLFALPETPGDACAPWTRPARGPQ